MNKDELIALDDLGIGAWDTHDVDSFAAMFANDFVYADDTVPETMTWLNQVREYMTGLFSAFPDMRVKKLNRVVGGDALAAEVKFTGTNSGPLSIGGTELQRLAAKSRLTAPISFAPKMARSPSSTPTPIAPK
jgi:hypothetical protein